MREIVKGKARTFPSLGESTMFCDDKKSDTLGSGEMMKNHDQRSCYETSTCRQASARLVSKKLSPDPTMYHIDFEHRTENPIYTK